MALAVIVATSGLMPFMSAISSMHSIVMSVESMSIATTRTRSRVRSCGTKAASQPSACARVTSFWSGATSGNR